MDIQIIVDSCCDLTPALRNLLRVSVASLKIDVGSIHYVDDGRIDGKKRGELCGDALRQAVR